MKKNKSNKKQLKKIPDIKKEIKDFLLNEEGKISKKNVVKIGVSMAVLGMALKSQDASAHTNILGTHTSSFTGTAHQSGQEHNSHTSHSAHGSGGWC